MKYIIFIYNEKIEGKTEGQIEGLIVEDRFIKYYLFNLIIHHNLYFYYFFVDIISIQ